MRKIVAAALAVGMAAMTVTGCSSSKSESKETTKATAEASKAVSYTHLTLPTTSRV